MGQYLGRVGSFLLGNTQDRFLGRRMHRSDFESMRSQLASPQAWNNPLDRAREMSTWATIVYQMRFGTTPQSEYTWINGWTLTNETGANHPADLDALTYQNGINGDTHQFPPHPRQPFAAKRLAPAPGFS